MARKTKNVPVSSHGVNVNPETGETAPVGYCWVRNIMSRKWMLEAIGTPFNCSVSSESYWSA